MINAKVKIFFDYETVVEKSLNEFLKTIDIDFEDIRDLKIDSIIDQKVL